MSEDDAGSSPPARHRADDDVEGLASGTFESGRTPNGDADLLSGEAALALDAAPPESPPHASFSIDEGEEEDDDVPTSLDPSAATTRGQDPDGGDETRRASVDSASDVAPTDSNANPKIGTKVAKLSVKTNKIMSDYQAYLAEIETEFPSDGATDPALASVNGMRDDVRDAYCGDLAVEEGVIGGLPPVREDGYITGGGHEHNIALARDWYYGKDDANIAKVDRTGAYDDFDDEEQRQLVRGQGYTRGFLHSRRFKRGLLSFVAVSAILGLTVGLATRNKKKNLPDWEGQMEKEEEGGSPDGTASSSGKIPPWDPQSPLNEAYTQETMYEHAAMRYKPLDFDRDNGWYGQTYDDAIDFCNSKPGYVMCPYEAVCPVGEGSEPLGGYKESISGDWSWTPILNKPNEWVQVGRSDGCIQYSHMHDKPPEWGLTGDDNMENSRNNIMCCLGDSLGGDEVTYESVEIKYRPMSFDRANGWDGKTYPEAVVFCGNVEDESYGLCPYEAVCPLGPDTEPLGGARGEGIGEMWLPVLDGVNQWVQVGHYGGSCITYSHEHADQPDWGMSGEQSEKLTASIMCCMATNQAALAGDAIMYELAISTYHPHLYDRSMGWSGQTFEEAMDFCDAIEGYELCPYDAVCPLGTNHEPLSAYAEGTAWVPILDSANEWVQVGRDEACVRWLHEHAEGPEWGLNGIGNEDITRNIMCCAHPGYVIDDEAEPHPNQIVEAPEVPKHSEDDTGLYALIMAKYQPTWWNRDQGWTGQTYLEALQFCGSAPDGLHELCPLEAICPLGPDTEPLGGYRDEAAGTWVPILGVANEWVQVSSAAAGGGSCITYDHEYKDPTPQWGLTGEGDEEITRHVACCLVQEGEGVTAITSTPLATPATVPSTVAAAANEDFAVGGNKAAGIAEEQDEQYIITAKKYRPEWHTRERGWGGKTYIEAVQFCEEKEGYGLCPFMALCPFGPDTQPLGGYDLEDPEGSWVPIVDAPNDWVQVGGVGNTCIRYSNEHPDPPEWGITGEGSDEVTRRLVCCIDEGTEYAGMDPNESDYDAAEGETTAATAPALTVATSSMGDSNGEDAVSKEQMSMVYKNVSEVYHPKWFDRSKGWKGQTYTDAFLFCSDFDFYLPCPYEVICPLGKGSVPLGGHRDSNPDGLSWAPIMDGPNQWVQLSDDASCVQWSHLHPGPPPWGETGEDNEELTRNVACCLDVTVTADPTKRPTERPTTAKPTTSPPTKDPTQSPTSPPTLEPTPSPTPLPTELPTVKPTPRPTLSDEEYYKVIVERLEPTWFDRSNGWEGQTYLDALQFCATKQSRVPCPYIAYCPIGTANHPLGGVKDGVSWAPIIDAPNAWVQVGEEAMCELYSELYNSPPQWGLTGKFNEDLTRHVMCCLEEALDTPEEPPREVSGEEVAFTKTEQAVLDVFKAQWYGREEGYQGTTYAESVEFCKHIAGMDLCPYEAYCPNGPVSDHVSKPLFLQLTAFHGEQWAPAKTHDDEEDTYLLIGTISNNPVTTCHTYRHFHDGEMPAWGLDGSSPELKLNILCCKDPDYISKGISNPSVDLTIGGPEMPDERPADFDVELAIENDLEPQWFNLASGWLGGSHDDAEDFCNSQGGKQICPYAAYCPHGPGQPVSKGHSTDISAEGAQWSPVFGHENHWVMVGQKHGNSATTCFGHEDLEGGPPAWGQTQEEGDIKKYIMCCRISTQP